MQAGFQPILLKARLLKNHIVRDETGFRSRLSGLSDYRKKAVYKLFRRYAPTVFILIDFSVLINPNTHVIR